MLRSSSPYIIRFNCSFAMLRHALQGLGRIFKRLFAGPKYSVASYAVVGGLDASATASLGARAYTRTWGGLEDGFPVSIR